MRPRRARYGGPWRRPVRRRARAFSSVAAWRLRNLPRPASKRRGCLCRPLRPSASAGSRSWHQKRLMTSSSVLSGGGWCRVSVHGRRPMEGEERVWSWVGRALIDRDGATIGRIEEVFVDEQTGKAKWAAVQASERSGEPAMVPLGDVVERSERLRVSVGRAPALAAPGRPGLGGTRSDGARADSRWALHGRFRGACWSARRESSRGARGDRGPPFRRALGRGAHRRQEDGPPGSGCDLSSASSRRLSRERLRCAARSFTSSVCRPRPIPRSPAAFRPGTTPAVRPRGAAGGTPGGGWPA